MAHFSHSIYLIIVRNMECFVSKMRFILDFQRGIRQIAYQFTGKVESKDLKILGKTAERSMTLYELLGRMQSSAQQNVFHLADFWRVLEK